MSPPLSSGPRVLVYLLRRDLRLADNPVLSEISNSSENSGKQSFTHLLPLYVFPAHQVEVSGFIDASSGGSKSPYPEARSRVGGFWRCGPHRARFLAEAVWDLRKRLESAGSGLVIRAGMAADVVGDVLDYYAGGDGKSRGEVAGVWMTEEDATEERKEERDVRKVVESRGVEFKLWKDEKYFVDECVSLPLHAPLSRPSHVSVINT